jgi:methylglutamate dehydrogenase subunit D
VVDVVIIERRGVAVASIMARPGVNAANIGSALGVDLPDGSGWAGSNFLMLLGYGPGNWLAFADPAPEDWTRMLQTKLNGLASVSDQSGAYVILRLTGRESRQLLQRGVSIDLHHSKFGPGSAVVSQIAHIGIIIWQVDKRPVFDVAIPRSFAFSFGRWLNHTISHMVD